MLTNGLNWEHVASLLGWTKVPGGSAATMSFALPAYIAFVEIAAFVMVLAFAVQYVMPALCARFPRLAVVFAGSNARYFGMAFFVVVALPRTADGLNIPGLPLWEALAGLGLGVFIPVFTFYAIKNFTDILSGKNTFTAVALLLGGVLLLLVFALLVVADITSGQGLISKLGEMFKGDIPTGPGPAPTPGS